MFIKFFRATSEVRFSQAVFPSQFLGTLVLGSLFGFAQAAGPTDGADVNDISITGEITVLYLDDFENRRSQREYFIEDKQSKRRFKLKFKSTPPGHLRTGSRLQVRGRVAGSEIFVAADGADSSSAEAQSSAPAVAGEQKVIAMVANFSDSNSCSTDSVNDVIFADPLNNSVDDLYRETSQGAVWLSGTVAGPYAISGTSAGACEWNNWINEVEAAAIADGVNLAAYDRKVFVLPRNQNCGFSGLGTVGGNPSTALIMACDVEDVYAHELGHNLGMNHASSSTQEYGDGSDFMGMSGMALRQINAPHHEQVGWRDSGQIQLITSSGFYDIAPLESSASQALAPQILKIAKPDSGEHYYLSYRRPIGFDQNLLPGWLNKTSVHRYAGNGGKTYWLTVLGDEQSYVDNANAITITQRTNTADYATVEIQLDGSAPTPTCTVASPRVDLSPANQSGDAGDTLAYSVTVTNQDSAECGASNFALTAGVPSGWNSSVTPSSVNLAPGAATTATLFVTSTAEANGAGYNVSVTATDNTEVAHVATGNASYTVVSSCVSAAPGLSVSPVSQSGDPGTTLVYSISLMNNDSSGCGSSTFDLAATTPSGWSASLSPQNLTLSAGASASVSLSVASPSAAAAGSYAIQVSTSDVDNSLHAKTANATYSVNEVVTAGDTQAPSVPAGLSASANSKQINLSWLASTDNVGVAGYRVYRDGIQIAATSSTGYSDKSATTGVAYAYSVAAYDAAGNGSARSGTVSATKGKTRGGGGSGSKGGGRNKK